MERIGFGFRARPDRLHLANGQVASFSQLLVSRRAVVVAFPDAVHPFHAAPPDEVGNGFPTSSTPYKYHELSELGLRARKRVAGGFDPIGDIPLAQRLRSSTSTPATSALGAA